MPNLAHRKKAVEVRENATESRSNLNASRFGLVKIHHAIDNYLAMYKLAHRKKAVAESDVISFEEPPDSTRHVNCTTAVLLGYYWAVWRTWQRSFASWPSEAEMPALHSLLCVE
jgi:hypothetical protein